MGAGNLHQSQEQTMNMSDLIPHDPAAMRGKWKFNKSTDDLKVAAAKKALFRKGREDFWKSKFDEVMAEIKNSGIEVNESINSGYSTSNTGYRKPEIQVKPELEEKIGECHNKIKEHSNAFAAYNAWAQVFEGNPGVVMELNFNDWLYFFSEEI